MSGVPSVPKKVMGPFFFREPFMTQDLYLAMLEEFVYAEFNQVGDVISQQDGMVRHHTEACVSKGG